jgi:arylmalonate decarboxylase
MPRPSPRIGFIVPSINVVAEDDMVMLARALPQAPVGVHFARAVVDTARPVADQFRQMLDAAPAHAAALAQAGVAVTAFACTSGSFFQGPGADLDIAARLSARSGGLPALTTATAAVAALHALGVRRVSIATPYLDWVVQAERAFFEQAGFEVMAINGLQRRGGADIHDIDDAILERLVAEVDRPGAEAVFVSCTDLPALGLVEQLEARHGKPVVTSNQATWWACAQVAGIGPRPGAGRLLREAPPWPPDVSGVPRPSSAPGESVEPGSARGGAVQPGSAQAEAAR